MRTWLRTFRFFLPVPILLAAVLLGTGSPAQQRATFDHLTTGFELTGRHRDLPCEQCHANALFKGTPRDCASCHGIGTAVRATAKSANHILSTEQCDSCHATIAWVPAVNFDHTQTHGSCSTCHNNVQAQGKGPQHIATNLECDVCHSTVSWSGALFNHEGITGGCAQCHNGVTATGLPASHIPTAGASCESCHSSTSFQTFAGATMNHSAVAGIPCASCHEAGKTFIGVTITTRPPPPHPAGGDCGTCHSSTSSFGGLAQLPPNHIPTSQPCSQCHSNANDFSVYTMNHTGITSGCANCHGAGLSFANIAPPALKEIPANHIPIGSAPCESCHSRTNFTTFAGTAMNHSAVSAVACSSCHEAGRSFVGSPPIVTRPPAPHVAGGECSNCHFSTTTFLGAQSMPPNHIPLPAADGGNCALCHTNANDYSVYAMNHNGIVNNCAQCHGSGLSFANIAPPALKQPPRGPPAHIPTGNIACELCHSPTNFITFSGTIIRHAAVAGQACDSCHELGMSWYGINNLWVRDGADHHRGMDCGGSNCHSPRDTAGGGGGGNAVSARIHKTQAAGVAATASGLTRAAALLSASGSTLGASGSTLGASGSTGAMGGAVSPAGSTARAASSGGATAGAAAVPLNPHLAGWPDIGIFGTVPAGARAKAHGTTARCEACHAPPTVPGIADIHSATTRSCENCHTGAAWLPVTRVDHSQVRGPCATCHNGVMARTVSHRHVPVTRNCEGCHTTNAWTPARFEHSALAGQSCAGCHDSVHAAGMPRSHIPTSRQCDACHGTLAWSPVKLDHTNLTAACSSCHNNAGAIGKPPGHMVTARDCSACHTYPDWSLQSFRHLTAQYPGQHRSTLECHQCHSGNTEKATYAAPAQGGTCGACHAKDFKPAAHPKTVKGQVYLESELSDCTGACHVYADDTHAAILRNQRGPHHRVTDGSFHN